LKRLLEEKEMFDKKNFSESLWKSIVLAFILIAAGSQSAWAFSSIKTNFLTAYPSAAGSRLDTLPSAPNHCGACHYNFNSSPSLNPYGQAILAGGTSAAQILAIGSNDSDGDGYTNNEEIQGIGFSNIPTFPGLTPSNVSSVSGVTLSEINGFLVPVASAVSCNNASDCDDTLFCNGIESCSSETSLCVAGTDPCTGATPACVEEGTGTCVECVIDADCAVGETCDVMNMCIAAGCPEGTPPEVLLYDTNGDCLLNKAELKNYSDTLKIAQKAEMTALKAKQTLEKDKYKAIKINYSN
jgi:hypothetical protein